MTSWIRSGSKLDPGDLLNRFVAPTQESDIRNAINDDLHAPTIVFPLSNIIRPLSAF